MWVLIKGIALWNDGLPQCVVKLHLYHGDHAWHVSPRMKAGLCLSLRQVTCVSAPCHFHLVVLQFSNIHLRTLWKWGFAWPDQDASQGLLKNQFLWSFPLSASCVTCCVILVNDLRKKKIKSNYFKCLTIIKFGVFAFNRMTDNSASINFSCVYLGHQFAALPRNYSEENVVISMLIQWHVLFVTICQIIYQSTLYIQ